MLTTEEVKRTADTRTFRNSYGTAVLLKEENLNIFSRKINTNSELNVDSAYSGRYNTQTCIGFFDCFDPFWKRYTEPFYFAFPSMPTWYNKVIDEFNTTFKNIQIKVLLDKELFIRSSPYMNTQVLQIFIDKNGEGKYYDAKRAIFSLELSDKFSDFEVRKVVTYLVHHFLRLFSYQEKTYINLDDEDPGENYLQFAIDLNNRSLQKPFDSKKTGYRSLSEDEITLQNFLNLDNIDLVNFAFVPKNIKVNCRQTFLLKLISLKEFSESDIEEIKGFSELYTGNDFSPHVYGVSNDQALMGIIGGDISSDVVRVKILDHRLNRGFRGEEYIVGTRHLRKTNIEDWDMNNTRLLNSVRENYLRLLEKES